MEGASKRLVFIFSVKKISSFMGCFKEKSRLIICEIVALKKYEVDTTCVELPSSSIPRYKVETLMQYSRNLCQ